MKILSLCAAKGGVGKSTLATALGVAAEQDGITAAIFDLDPQASATFWYDTRGQEKPAVASIQAVRLPHMLKAAQEGGCQLAIVDTPPFSKDIAFEAAERADLVLIPTRPATFDVMAVTHTIELVKHHRKPYAVVLTFCPPRQHDVDIARNTLQQLGAVVALPTIGHRVAYSRAQQTGLAAQEIETDGKAAEEVRALWIDVKTSWA